MPLLPAEAVLGILLRALVVGRPAALVARATSALAGLVELAVDGDVEVRLVGGGERVAILGTLCSWGGKKDTR